MDALLLEDDVSQAKFLVRAMSEKGFVVDRCDRGDDAVARAEARRYDIVVLDRMVAGTDGLAVCSAIRRTGGSSPILMLTPRSETCQGALDPAAGADDYLLKPFDVEEFFARIHALVQRTSRFGVLRCGELTLDLGSRQATLAGSPLSLTKREYALLVHLVHRGNRLVTRSELLARVWGMPFDPCSNVVQVHLSRLRKKLGASSVMIETVRRVGYRLRRPAEA
jgi:two-component system OmpR family response regulator